MNRIYFLAIALSCIYICTITGHCIGTPVRRTKQYGVEGLA